MTRFTFESVKPIVLRLMETLKIPERDAHHYCPAHVQNRAPFLEFGFLTERLDAEMHEVASDVHACTLEHAIEATVFLNPRSEAP